MKLLLEQMENGRWMFKQHFTGESEKKSKVDIDIVGSLNAALTRARGWFRFSVVLGPDESLPEGTRGTSGKVRWRVKLRQARPAGTRSWRGSECDDERRRLTTTDLSSGVYTITLDDGRVNGFFVPMLEARRTPRGAAVLVAQTGDLGMHGALHRDGRFRPGGLRSAHRDRR